MSSDAGMPEAGEIVICTVREITSHGIYVNLDQYEGMNGFLHVSEISTGWVKNIERVAKVQQKLVLKVIRANRMRNSRIKSGGPMRRAHRRRARGISMSRTRRWRWRRRRL